MSFARPKARESAFRLQGLGLLTIHQALPGPGLYENVTSVGTRSARSALRATEFTRLFLQGVIEHVALRQSGRRQIPDQRAIGSHLVDRSGERPIEIDIILAQTVAGVAEL